MRKSYEAFKSLPADRQEAIRLEAAAAVVAVKPAIPDAVASGK